MELRQQQALDELKGQFEALCEQYRNGSDCNLDEIPAYAKVKTLIQGTPSVEAVEQALRLMIELYERAWRFFKNRTYLEFPDDSAFTRAVSARDLGDRDTVLGCPKCGHEWPHEEGPPCPSCGH